MGEENPVFTILADSLFETQNQLAMTNHYFDCQVLLINKTLYEGLSAEQQKVLKEEAVNAQNLTRKMISEGESAVVEELKKKGMNVTYPDRASFVNKMSPAYEKVAQLAGQEAMDEVLNAVKAGQ